MAHTTQYRRWCVCARGLITLPLLAVAPYSVAATPEISSSAPTSASFDPTVTTKRVLVLNAYHEGYHWTDRVMAGVKAVLQPEQDVELFINYMDSKRNSDPDYFEALKALYRTKYRYLAFDAILSSDDHALNFLLAHRDDLFPGVPVVFSGINDFDPNRIAGHTLYTGVYESYDVAGTVELMLRLHPRTRRIVAISDATYSGNAFRQRVIRAEPRFAGRIQFVHLTNLPPATLESTLASLQDDTLVLWVTYLRTPTGISISSEDSVRFISKASRRPVYCIWDVVGQGVVGGYITSPDFQGQAAAKMVLKLLRGTPIERLPVSGSPMAYTFDYAALKRFGIAESTLPAASLILNKPFSLYEEYKITIWAVTVSLLALLILVLCLLYYIGKRKQAEHALSIAHRQLVQSRKMEAIGQLAGGVAHDFNNILAGISGAAEMLRMTMAGEQDSADRNFVDVILRATARASQLTAKLLAFGRKGVVATAPLDVHATIRNAVEILRLSLDKRVSIDVSLVAKLYTVVMDESQITNALLNLGINAEQAMAGGGALSFRTRNADIEQQNQLATTFSLNAGRYIVIETSDTGSGIPPDKLERIFEPFYTTKEAGKGTGLGLAAVYGSVREHGGAIVVESEVGVGTSFQVYLPVTEESAREREESANETSGKGELILVVDDEDMVRQSVIAMLETLNYRVLSANNGHEAVEVFREHHKNIAVVLMDMIMPSMSGRAAYERMVRIQHDTKVLFSSGYISDEDIAEITRSGMGSLLRKPYRRAELARALNEVLHHAN